MSDKKPDPKKSSPASRVDPHLNDFDGTPEERAALRKQLLALGPLGKRTKKKVMEDDTEMRPPGENRLP